jgi:hypothetical protein
MTRGGERGFAKVSREIFPKFFCPIFAFWAAFKGFKDIILGKNYMSHYTDQSHNSQNDRVGSKISEKSVTYVLLEWPQTGCFRNQK